MNRRGFFALLAAAAVAPKALWAMVKRPKPLRGRVVTVECHDEFDQPIADLARERMLTLRQELEHIAGLELTADGEPQFATQDEFFKNRRTYEQHMRQTKGVPPRGIEYWIMHPSEIC